MSRKTALIKCSFESIVVTRGYVNGGAGIDLRPRDLARLGQFYLQGGASGATQILPRNWVMEATTPRFEWRSSYGALKSFSYGYLWWIEEGQQEPAFLAWGFGGQYVYVVPELKSHRGNDDELEGGNC